MKAVLRALVVAVAAVGLLAFAPLALAQQPAPPASQPQATPQQPPSNQATYLGVGIERVHPAFASHFPGILGQDQGLMVVDVAPNSPAAQAGLKPFEILASFNDQKLSSPEQLISLVQSAKPGQEVSFGILRQGKQETIKVKLGSATMEQVTGAQRQFMSRRAFRMHGQEGHGAAAQPMSWESFDSLTLKKLDNNRFKVDVTFRSKDKTEHRTFEGTRDEIRTQIGKAQDVPTAEKNLVLQSLDL